MIESYVPLAAVLTPLGAIPLIVASNRFRDIRETWTLMAAFVAFFLDVAA